jgi:flavin reductase (DIM6/NTAB) family NADH-FMN oxidoreductase RutF
MNGLCDSDNSSLTPRGCGRVLKVLSTFFAAFEKSYQDLGAGDSNWSFHRLTTMNYVMRNLPLSKVYQLLEPGPVVLLTTASKGRANVMAMSWHMMVEFTPPLVACIVSNADYSFAALRSTKECVIAIPSRKLARKVVSVGNYSGEDVDKFKRFGLTAVPAKHISAPLVDECFANLECKVVNTRLVSQYNLFVLEVVKAWIDPAQKSPKTIHHHGYGEFIVDGEKIKLKSQKP